MRHDSPEELKRALDKSKEKLRRQRLRSKKLRILLDTRTKKMVALWGHLEDIRRDVDLIEKSGDPGDWPQLVQTVRKLVSNYTTMEATEKDRKSTGIFQSAIKWLRRKGDPDGQ